jgi:hypothetical protein
LAIPTNREADETGHLPIDDQGFEELAIAEEELIDAYVRNELPADERKLLEKGLSGSPELVGRLHFAKLLAKAASPGPQRQMSATAVGPEPSKRLPETEGDQIPWWKGLLRSSAAPRRAFQMSLAAGVILLLLGGFALLAGWMKLRSELRRLDSERAALEQQKGELEKKSAEERSRSEQLTAELQREKQQREQAEKLFVDLKRSRDQNDQSKSLPSAVVSLMLLPVLARDISGGANELIVSRGTSTVRLKLGLEAADYSIYRAVIKNAQGLQLTKTGLKPRRTSSGKILLVQVSSNRLPPGDYIVHVSGITSSGTVESVEDYAFRLRKKPE